MITYQRSLQIRTKAIDLIHSNCINSHKKINLKYILCYLDYSIICQMADLKGLSGFTCFDEEHGKYGMFLDHSIHSLCPARTRFTVAHELGHIILGHFNADFSNSAFIGDYIMEDEANEFADELLMPTKPILEHQMTVRQIILQYDVSTSAALNKITYMKNNPIYLKLVSERELDLFVGKKDNSRYYSDPRNIIIEELHDRWLDPDYAYI